MPNWKTTAGPEPGDDPVVRRARARVGTVLRSKWRLERLLGVGGMACVYAATHRNGKKGAVKLLHAELAVDEEARARFLREGYVANKVDHPGAVSVLDDDTTDDGSVFLVMELLEGQSVESRAASRPGRRLEVGEVVGIADQLLEVLAAAHEKGIVHRDLKPENLFLTRDGQLKVLDFGLARLRELSQTTGATRTGSLMGTPSFMPPEQALGNVNQVDGRTDLWAVGATMFALLTGRDVHEADTVNQLLLAAMTRPAPKIATVMPSIPPALAAVVDCALSFEQSARWPDARAMQGALRELAGPQPSLRAPTVGEAPAPPRNPSAPGPVAAATGHLTAAPVSRDPSFAAPSPKKSRAPLVLGIVGVTGSVAAVVAGIVLVARSPSSTSASPEVSSGAPTVQIAAVASAELPAPVSAAPPPETAPVPEPTSQPASSAGPTTTASAKTPPAAKAPRHGATTGTKPPAARSNPLDTW